MWWFEDVASYQVPLIIKGNKARGGGWDADGCTITNISHISGRWLILFWFHLYKIKWTANERTTNMFLIWHLHLLHSIVDIERMNVWGCFMVVVPSMEVERVHQRSKIMDGPAVGDAKSGNLQQRSGISYAQKRCCHDSGVCVNSQ